MEVVNRHAAGVDVGSRSHFVAIGQGTEDVKEFGVYNDDLRKLVEWLRKHEITTVAMESTGTNGAYMLHLAESIHCAAGSRL